MWPMGQNQLTEMQIKILQKIHVVFVIVQMLLVTWSILSSYLSYIV